MSNSQHLTEKKETTPGDAAVDGLFGGAAAGIVMAVYLVIVSLLTGEGPGVMLGRFAAGELTSPFIGGLSHLAVSATYGAIFGLMWRAVAAAVPARRGVAAWLGGLVYGIVLLIVASIVLPRVDSPLREIPWAHFAVAHVIYGLTLGALVARRAA